MQKGLGISALVLAIVAIFLALIGPWLTLLVALLAAFSYGPGLSFGISSIVLNIINIIFLSPTVWVDAAATGGKGGGILFSAQIIAGIALFVLHKKNSAGTAS